MSTKTTENKIIETPVKRGRGRPKKLHTEQDKILANRAGFKKYMDNAENKALQRARYTAWFTKNKEAIYARRKAKRDDKAEKQRLDILGEIRKEIAHN